MAFTHGVYKSEVPTSILSPVEGESGLPVVIGSAPIFLGDEANINKPVLCYSYAEAIKAFGYSEDWEKFTLCEFIYSQFALYGQAPAVIINVFDPEKHSEKISGKEFVAISNVVNLGKNIIKSKGFEFKNEDDEEISISYAATYNDDGDCVITFAQNITGKIKATFTQAKPELISEADIIGGYNQNTGKYTGLELVSRVYPMFRIIPGIIAAPKYSEKSEVAAVMSAKCKNINGVFSCISVVDIPSDNSNAPSYSLVTELKNLNNIVNENQIACWPMVKLGDKKYHLSTQLVGLMNRTDRNNDDMPYKSPSNEILQIDGAINASGEEINLGLDEANYLNSQGIFTALNFSNGWVAWGNRTACYPNSTDVKDCFIPVRRMFDYVGNTFITTFWQKVDAPITLRLIRTVINTFNIYLNGLMARGIILGGRIEFNENDNDITSLMNGTLRFHVFLTPPVPAETIEAVLEYDPAYLQSLFE